MLISHFHTKPLSLRISVDRSFSYQGCVIIFSVSVRARVSLKACRDIKPRCTKQVVFHDSCWLNYAAYATCEVLLAGELAVPSLTKCHATLVGKWPVGTDPVRKLFMWKWLVGRIKEGNFPDRERLIGVVLQERFWLENDWCVLSCCENDWKVIFWKDDFQLEFNWDEAFSW